MKLVVILLSLIFSACTPGLKEMRILDGYITQAQTVCDKAKADATVVPDARQVICRRMLTCVDPAQKAQHAIRDYIDAKRDPSRDLLTPQVNAKATYATASYLCRQLDFKVR